MFVVPYTNLATSSLTTATTKRQQSPKGKQFNRGEKERKAERVERGCRNRERRREGGSKREEATGSQLDNFILQGSQKMCTVGSREGRAGGRGNCQGVCNT